MMSRYWPECNLSMHVGEAVSGARIRLGQGSTRLFVGLGARYEVSTNRGVAAKKSDDPSIPRPGGGLQAAVRARRYCAAHPHDR